MQEIYNHLRTIAKGLDNYSDKNIEDATINILLSTPFRRASQEQIYEIVINDYFPGLFYITERKASPSFLFDENNLTYDEWIKQKLLSEINQIEDDAELFNSIIELGGKEKLLGFCLRLLKFKTHDNSSLESLILNQEYSDFFRRIAIFLLKGNPFYICNSHKSFNQLGKKVIPNIVNQTKSYSLRDKLYISIASGMIGMDIKEKLIHTSPIDLLNNVRLDISNPNDTIDSLNNYIKTPGKIGIDSFSEFIQDISIEKDLRITWFTDDYIETMFELSFIEGLLLQYCNLFITIVPRYDSYSNDASYADIFEFLRLPVFSLLYDYYHKGRLNICRDGMDISTVDFFRMSEELFNIMRKTDICVVSGARAYEMTQGIRIKTYYTGIAVCKSYTESLTGFSKRNGTLVFLSQEKGERSFIGFKERAHRRIADGNDIIPVAKVTAREYNQKKRNEKLES